jgi:hypothetical protein
MMSAETHKSMVDKPICSITRTFQTSSYRKRYHRLPVKLSQPAKLTIISEKTYTCEEGRGRSEGQKLPGLL